MAQIEAFDKERKPLLEQRKKLTAMIKEAEKDKKQPLVGRRRTVNSQILAIDTKRQPLVEQRKTLIEQIQKINKEQRTPLVDKRKALQGKS